MLNPIPESLTTPISALPKATAPELSAAPMRVSVVVPTKNRADLLRAALASIRAIEGPDLVFEIIVGDNGSTDDTAAVAAAAGARVVHAATLGAAAARNAALRAATGDFIAFLDDDDVWLAEHIRPQLAFLQMHQAHMAAIGQVVVTDANLENPAPPLPVELPVSGNVFPAFLAHYPQIGGTVVRASVRDTVGFFDE